MKKPILILLASTAFAASSLATPIPDGLTWLPSDPLDITLDGNQTYDLWLNLSGSANNLREVPFIFGGVVYGYSPYSIPGNPGYGMFPGNSPETWTNPIKAQLWTGDTQGELWKVSNGTGGGPFPSGSTIYYGGASPIANTDGGTLGAKSYAIEGIQTITFQLSLGEAYGYTLWDADGDGFDFAADGPTLTLFDIYGGEIGTLSAADGYADIIKKAYNGSLDMPPGSGVDEDIYINTFGLQWDLSGFAEEIGSFQINWTAVQHAQLWSFRVDQTDYAYDRFVFDITSHWTDADDKMWSTAANWQDDTIPSAVGKAVFGVGDGVELSADTTVGQVTINSDQNFVISSSNNSKLTVSLNIITEANGGPADHTVSTDLVLPTTVTFDVGEDTTLTLSGGLSGVGFYKRGTGELTLSGDNSFTGNLIFAGGTTVVSGSNTTSGGSILDIKNARVILQGSDRLSSTFGVKLAGTSSPGQTAYLQLGDESTGAVTQTLAQLNAAKPQYVKDLNPDPQSQPPVYVVGGSSEISILTVKGGLYSGYLGGDGLHENNFSLVVDGSLTLQGISTYVGDTVIKSNAVLQINQAEALSANSNLVMDGGILALGTYTYKINDGSNGPGIDITKSVDTFTRSLGTGAGEIQFTGDGGFRAVGGDRTVNLGGDGGQVVWGEGHFVGNGNKLILASDNTSRIIFTNAIDLGSASRTVEITPNSTAELSGVLSGSGGLIKAGNGFLFLSGLNTYSGATRIEGGQLRFSEIGNAGGPSILGNTSNAASNLILAGGQLNYVGSVNSNTDRLFTIAGATGTIANDGTGTVRFTNTGAVAYSYAGAVTLELRGTNNNASRFDALIADNGSYKTSLKKGGSSGVADTGGYWIIGNENNSYTGSTFINSGILEITKFSNGGQNSSIGASSNAAANLAIFRGSIKYTGDGDSTDRLFAISGYGSTYSPSRIDSSGTGALKFTNTGAIGLTNNSGTVSAIGTGGWLALGGTNADDNTLAALIGGTGGSGQNSSTILSRLTKDGTGKWILANTASTYTGITEILGGTLGVSKLANGGQVSSIGTSTNAADRLVINGGTLQYLGSGDSTDRRFTVGTNGASLDSSGTGAVNFTNTAAVTYATTNVARTLTLAGTNTGSNTLAAAIGNAGTGATSLVKNGAGRWVLKGANTYTGTTKINAGILQFAQTASLLEANRTAARLVVESGATAAFNVGGSGEFTAENIDALKALGTADGGFKNGSALGLDTTNASGGNFTYGSVIGNTNDGTNQLGLTKLGAGTLTLTGNNTYTGATTLSGGTLALGSAGAIGDTGSIVFDGGILQFSADNTTDYSFRFAEIAAGRFARIDTNGHDIVFNSILNGSGGLEKLGTGSLTLNADNTFSGNTVISGGWLVLGSATALQYSTVILNGGSIDYGSFEEVDLGNLEGDGEQTISEGVTFNIGNSDPGSSSTFSGELNGAGNLNKTGESTLVLEGASTHFTGQAAVTSGSLVLANNHALGSAAVSVAGGTLQVTAGTKVSNDVTFAGGGSVQRAVTSGSGYDLGTTGTVASANPGGVATSVALLDSQASSAPTTLDFSLSTAPTSGFAVNDHTRVSDVFSLSGTGTDIFVLQLSIATGLAGNSFLAWLNAEGVWVNAVEGNNDSGALGSIYGALVTEASGLRGYQGSFLDSGITASALYLGAWGVDAAAGSAWAVLNHNSDFSINAVPEPSAGLLLLLGVGAFALRRRKRISKLPATAN